MTRLGLCFFVLSTSHVIAVRSMWQGYLPIWGVQTRLLDDHSSGSGASIPIAEPMDDNLMARAPSPAPDNDTLTVVSEPTIAWTSPPSIVDTEGNVPVSATSKPTTVSTRAPSIMETQGSAPVTTISNPTMPSTRAPSVVSSPTVTQSPANNGPSSHVPTPTNYQQHGSQLPTDVPAAAPSNFQSTQPTRKPTSNPTRYPSYSTSSSTTNLPTLTTTVYPYPTPLSFASPTVIPTSEPSLSTSMMPTGSASFVTTPIDESGKPIENGGGYGGSPTGGSALLSTCPGRATNETGALDTLYMFQYEMLLNSSSSADAVALELEAIIHQQLGLEFLTCNFQERRRLQQGKEDEPFTMINLNSLPVDKVSDTACESSGAGVSCFLVDAGFSSNMLFSSSPEQVLQILGIFLTKLITSELFLNADPTIHRLSFRGFPEGTVIVSPTPPTDSERPVNEVQSTSSFSEVSGMVGGTVAVVVAVVVALLTLLLVVRRRKKQNLYRKQIDERSLADDSGTYLSDEGLPKFIVVEDDEIGYRSYDPTDAVVASYGQNQATSDHDTRTCNSTYCPQCQADQLLVPTFVPAEVMSAHIKRDLAPPRPPRARRGFQPSDTVDF